MTYTQKEQDQNRMVILYLPTLYPKYNWGEGFVLMIKSYLNSQIKVELT